MVFFKNNEIVNFIEMTKYEEIDVRFIELMPWEKLSLGMKINLLEVTKYYKLPNGKGRIGLIQPMTCKFCGDCNRIRLTSDGKIRYCLHSDEELDLKLEEDGVLIKATVKNFGKTGVEMEELTAVSIAAFNHI